MQKLEEHSVQTNIHGILQQRRLWHIQSISARSLTINKFNNSNKPKDGNLINKPNQFFIEVSITDVDKEDIYKSKSTLVLTSDEVPEIPNPSWSFQTVPMLADTARSKFSVTLWQKNKNGERKEHFSWNIKLKKLVYVNDYLPDVSVTFTENSLIFKINGSFYTYAKWITRNSEDRPIFYPKYELENHKSSSSFFNLQRIVANKRLISQKIEDAKDFAIKAETLTKQRADSLGLSQSSLHETRCRVLLLKKLLAKEKLVCDKEKISLEKKRTILLERQKQCEVLKEDTEKFKMKKSKVLSSHSCVHKNSKLALVNLRSKQNELLSELVFIFPIKDGVGIISKKVSKHAANLLVKYPDLKPYSIGEIYLPDSESMPVKEDTNTSIALGYVAQVLQIISCLLSIPLRYPIKLKGSQCQISDTISEKLQDHERLFSLYGRGNKERYLFDYAVYILNKNIAQFRHLYGIPTTDLRPTLKNIKSFLDHLLDLGPSACGLVSPKSPRALSPPTVKSSLLSKKPPNANAKLLEKNNMTHKAVNLENLRGELFGSSRKRNVSSEKSSPRKSSFPNQQKPVKVEAPDIEPTPPVAPSNIPHPSTKTFELKVIPDYFDVDSLPAKSGLGTQNLTGLEELEGNKNNSKKQGVKDSAARSELFSTKYGHTASGRRVQKFRTSPRQGRANTEFSKAPLFANGQNLIIPVMNGRKGQSEEKEDMIDIPDKSVEAIANNNNPNIENKTVDAKSSMSANSFDEELDLC